MVDVLAKNDLHPHLQGDKQVRVCSILHDVNIYHPLRFTKEVYDLWKYGKKNIFKEDLINTYDTLFSAQHEEYLKRKK